jgi:uncharacterized membrane protein
MNPFADLLARQPIVLVHLASALAALALGVAILARRKGTSSHRAFGWTWVVLMGTAALTSAFIRDDRLPNLLGFTPIHAFTLLAAIGLPRAVWHAKRGNVAAHRRTMKGIYVGGCLIAGTFALMPGRFLGTLVWKHALGLMA